MNDTNKIKASIMYGQDLSSLKPGSFSSVPSDTFVAVVKLEVPGRDNNGNIVTNDFYHRMYAGQPMSVEVFIDTFNKNGSNITAMDLMKLKQNLEMGLSQLVIPLDLMKAKQGVYEYLDVEKDNVYGTTQEFVAGVSQLGSKFATQFEIIEPTVLEDEEEIHRKNG